MYPSIIQNYLRSFRENSGLFYHVVFPAKFGDIVALEDDYYNYDSFGILAKREGQLVIDMGHKHFVITDEIKQNILGGVDRFYFQGIKIWNQSIIAGTYVESQ